MFPVDFSSFFTGVVVNSSSGTLPFTAFFVFVSSPITNFLKILSKFRKANNIKTINNTAISFSTELGDITNFTVPTTSFLVIGSSSVLFTSP